MARLIEDYAAVSAAPVLTGTAVTAVRAGRRGYVVRTDRGSWHAPTVVVATGAAAVAVRAGPAGRPGARRDHRRLTAADYRNPDQLPDGGVLVVGASASGVQIAEELQRSGRPVTLAVGEHVRMPRTYRGRDILWWMDASGMLDERYDEVPDLVRARNLPSMQLVGSPHGRTVDLNALGRLGVRLVGRFAGVRDGHGAVLRVAAQRVRAGRPQAGPAAGQPSTPGRTGPGWTPRPAAAVRPDRGAGARRAVGAPRRRGDRARSSGRPATAPTCPWLDVAVFDRRGRVRARRRRHAPAPACT